MDTGTRRWLVALAIGAGVGVVAWLSNLTTETQMAGGDRVWWGVRTFVSRVVNSGTVWAGLPVLAGWTVRRPTHAVVAGVVVSEVALVVHYTVGSFTGTMPWASWGDNWYWFVAAVVLCAPLGLVGATARRRDPWGLACRLVVPVGAITESLTSHLLGPGFSVDLADRAASVAAGSVLLVGGLVGALVVLCTWWRTGRSGHGASTRASSPR